MLIDIAGDDAALILHERREMRRLAARCAATVDDELPRLGSNDMCHLHRALILYLEKALLQRRHRT